MNCRTPVVPYEDDHRRVLERASPTSAPIEDLGNRDRSAIDGQRQPGQRGDTAQTAALGLQPDLAQVGHRMPLAEQDQEAKHPRDKPGVL
jgi:hypothetical protein